MARMIDLHLTESEGMLLALVVRAEPITAYQIASVYDRSPVTNYNTSKGKIYPMVRRLKSRGLLQAETVEQDARRTERLSATAAGREAVRHWTKEILPPFALLEDPLRTRLQSFDLLTREERLEWCASAKAMLAEKLEQLEQYRQTVDVPFHGLVHDGAMSALRARIDWLDRVLIAQVREPTDQLAAADNSPGRVRSVTRAR